MSSYPIAHRCAVLVMGGPPSGYERQAWKSLAPLASWLITWLGLAIRLLRLVVACFLVSHLLSGLSAAAGAARAPARPGWLKGDLEWVAHEMYRRPWCFLEWLWVTGQMAPLLSA